VAIVGFVAIVDLLAYGWDVNVQCDRSLYYPPIPALTALANAPTPGRVLGVNCLPPNLNLMAGLSDVRGYDGVDPKLIVQVMNRARLRGTDVLNYAQLQWFAPDIDFSPNSLSPVPPILKMLNVRYFIMRGSNTNSINTIFSSADYLVIENPNTLPRAYVPRRVEVVAGPDARLDRLADRRFDPRWLALVNEPVDLPDTDIVGAVKITSEVPTRVTLDAQMQTAGLVVLADQWDKGWSATVDGRPAPIVHANHAIRGVVLPPGSHTIVMSYFPTSLKVGIAVGITGLAGLLAWMALLMFGAAGRKPSVVAG